MLQNALQYFRLSLSYHLSIFKWPLKAGFTVYWFKNLFNQQMSYVTFSSYHRNIMNIYVFFCCSSALFHHTSCKLFLLYNWPKFEIIFTELLATMPSIKIAQAVTLCWTKWTQELKVWFLKQHFPRNYWSKFKTITKKGSPKEPPPKLTKRFFSTKQ